MSVVTIPTFVINLKYRTDRREHIQHQFEWEREFNLHLVEATEHANGGIGLWKSITHILSTLVNDEDDYILICEDDHVFTKDYNKEHLFECITVARQKEADILLGGVSWHTSVLRVSRNIFWVEKFTGTQFMIIFRKFFRGILGASFENHDSADFKIGSLTESKFLIYPFISVQKDFGYSDATLKNNAKGKVSKLFDRSKKGVVILEKVKEFYQNKREGVNTPDDYIENSGNITIPTYIINLSESSGPASHIITQFARKSEFDIKLVNIVKHNVNAVAVWLSIRKVIKIAVENDDDVIIISTDDHEFTEHYSWKFLLKNIIEANNQKADYLAGGLSDFHVAVPITKSRFWVNSCFSMRFIIIYKRFFEKILAEPFDDKATSDRLFSEITSNKMVLFPFISRRMESDGAEVSDIHQAKDISLAESRLAAIQAAYLKYRV